MRAVILAAGFGTRLYPLTENQPKALLKIGGMTLLDHLMVKLDPIRTIEEIIVVTSGRFYLDFHRWRKEARYRKPIHIKENNAFHPGKSAGAVRDLYLGITDKQNRADDYLVLCSDNYFDYPLSHFLLPCLAHPRFPCVALYDLKDKSLASKYGVVEIDEHGKILNFTEKPSEPNSSLISLGIYYLPREFKLRVFEYLEIERLDPDRIGDLIAWLSRKETVYGIEFDGRWFDVGDMESLMEARKILNGSNAA